jgi:2-polyprenyl-3-methyl-5-hydroxy-6-metoxy-1,4-benzoquinol methylase/ribosomal protein S27AE
MPRGNRTFLLVPAAGAGEGMGHLARCLRLAGRLRGRVTFLTARMDSAARALLAEEIRRFPRRSRPSVIAKPGAGAFWDIILIDARRTRREELENLMQRGEVVCLDEGGQARDRAPFIVDALPSSPGSPPPNLSAFAFLGLPARARKRAKPVFGKVLVTFGGEDHENLSGKILGVLVREMLFTPAQLTVVEGPLFGARAWPEGIAVIKGAAGLASLLPDFDLVFTHFGMTAFEALATGAPVILLNPSSYHNRLAAAAGLPVVGIRSPDIRVLRSLLRAPGKLREVVDRFNAELGKDREHRLVRLLESLKKRGSSICPVCGLSGNKVIARYPERTYRRCGKCGIAYMESFAVEQKKYDKKYFSAEYRAQYGRTYLEDFDTIKAASRSRVRIIKALVGERPAGAVVDIGCAFGPFLDALRESGMPGYGVDVSPDAVAYVKKKLRIPAVCAAFEDIGRSALPRRISAVTLWYVIEHFQETDLALRKAASLLPVGGVIAFSTPNGRGISARRSLARYLEKSPSDHFTVFSPHGLRKLLSGYDLELRRIRVTGHHPERFPGALGRAANRSSGAFKLVHAASRLLRLGDTFEAYAVKGE